MKRIGICLLLIGAATATIRIAVGGHIAQTRKPNIIFILADDLGWGDLSVYGHERLKTPNLDKLAEQGTLFTQFYVNASVCSPSRCAFFTGQYPARHRIHGHYATPQQNTDRGMSQWLDPKVPNVAALLKSSGYATAHIGKWHLSPGRGTPESPDPAQPKMTDYGFDYGGSGEGATGPVVSKDDPYYRARSTALFVDEALKFIGEKKYKPFFVQLWTLAPHAMLNPTPEQRPFERFTPQNIAHKAAETIYYASVADLDAQVGRLVNELDKLGLGENTLIVFSSDNGPEDIHTGAAGHSGVGSAGPFRGRKRSLYEGGVRVPFIVRWPGKVAAGKVDDTSVVAGVDFLPTICKLAGVKVPEHHALDGEDQSDVLLGQSRPRRSPLMWEWRFASAGEVFHRSPMLAIREGDWKLLMNPDRNRVELYDIPRDPTQLNNLAVKRPEIVARLSEMVLAWQKTLPPGPVQFAAGRNDYRWPGQKDPDEYEGGRVSSTVSRTLKEIEEIYASMPPLKYQPPAERGKYLAGAIRRLREGGELRVVMLGDSIVNDTSRSQWSLLLEREFPQCAITKITSVRSATGCWWYKDNQRVKLFVLDQNPDLVIIGGISHRENIEAIRDVVRQIKAGSKAEILLMTGAFGRVDPYDDKQWRFEIAAGGNDYRARLRQLASELKVEFLDMDGPWGQYIRESGKELTWFKRDYIHANERGEQILGRILFRYLAPTAK